MADLQPIISVYTNSARYERDGEIEGGLVAVPPPPPPFPPIGLKTDKIESKEAMIKKTIHLVVPNICKITKMCISGDKLYCIK